MECYEAARFWVNPITKTIEAFDDQDIHCPISEMEEIEDIYSIVFDNDENNYSSRMAKQLLERWGNLNFLIRLKQSRN